MCFKRDFTFIIFLGTTPNGFFLFYVMSKLTRNLVTEISYLEIAKLRGKNNAEECENVLSKSTCDILNLQNVDEIVFFTWLWAGKISEHSSKWMVFVQTAIEIRRKTSVVGFSAWKVGMKQPKFHWCHESFSLRVFGCLTRPIGWIPKLCALWSPLQNDVDWKIDHTTIFGDKRWRIANFVLFDPKQLEFPYKPGWKRKKRSGCKKYFFHEGLQNFQWVSWCGNWFVLPKWWFSMVILNGIDLVWMLRPWKQSTSFF